MEDTDQTVLLLDFPCRRDGAVLKGVHTVLLSMLESQLLHFFKLLLFLQLHFFPHTHKDFTAEWVVLVKENGVCIISEEQIQTALGLRDFAFQPFYRTLVLLNKFLLLFELLELVHITSLQSTYLLVCYSQLFLKFL